MKRVDAIVTTMIVLLAAIVLLPSSAYAQDTGVVGAGSATLPANTLYGAVTVSAIQFGMAAFVPGDSTAEGHFQGKLLGTTILGLTQNIIVDGEITSGSLNTGVRTISGLATVDMGDGLPPLVDVPITVTATATSVTLLLGATNLPAATLSDGQITIF